MLTRSEKQEMSDFGTSVYADMEALIMQNIIRHIQNYDQPIDSDTWLMQKLAEVGKLNKENIKIIAKSAGLGATTVERMLQEVVAIVMERVEPGLNELERQKIVDGAVPPKESKNVQAAVKAVRNQALDSLNLCNTTMLYKARDAYKKLVKDIAGKAEEIANKQEFLDILGKHVNAEAIGAESRQQAIREVIKEFNKRGIPAFVDKKGREWTPEAYVSMTLRATAGNIANEATFARMDDRGISLLQISSHPGARPKCSKDQGKIFDRNNGSGYTTDLHDKKIRYYPLKDSSYGEPDGILGINCGHHAIPFIPGISRERYFPTKNFEENDKLYKKMQMQRSIERGIRRQKRECMLYNAAGDTEGFNEAAAKLKQEEEKMKSYLGQNPKLVRRKDREQVIGFDRSNSAKAVAVKKAYTKAMETDTIPVKDIKIPKSVGAKFKNYKVVDKTTGIEYEFAPGTRIQNGEVFAGKGTRHPLHEGVAEGLSKEFGGTPSKWQHAKGFGVLQDEETGEELQAEVHWFQEETVGKVKFKVKRWLDDEG